MATAIDVLSSGGFEIVDCMIGDITVSALTGLSIQFQKDVTRQQIEAGFSVIQGVTYVPLEITMQIVFANPDYSPEALLNASLGNDFSGLTETWREKRDALFDYFNNREIIDVTTHDSLYQNFIISNISPVYDSEENYDCYIAAVTLVEYNSNQASSISDTASSVTSATRSLGAL